MDDLATQSPETNTEAAPAGDRAREGSISQNPLPYSSSARGEGAARPSPIPPSPCKPLFTTNASATSAKNSKLSARRPPSAAACVRGKIHSVSTAFIARHDGVCLAAAGWGQAAHLKYCPATKCRGPASSLNQMTPCWQDRDTWCQETAADADTPCAA